MPAKNTPIRRIDQQQQQEDPRQASLLGAGNQSFSTQLTSVVEVPINVTAGATYIVYSHLTPTAAQELSWQNADSRTPDVYLVQWSTQSSFANAVTVATPNPSIVIDGLPTGTTIYYRVAARIAGQQSQWSASVSAITATDTTPPAAVSNAQWQWSGKTGDLTITWTPPTSPNYRDTRVVIRANAGGPVLREVYAVAGRYVWTRAQQAADTGGSYDSNVIVELTPRNTSNSFGSTVSINPVLSAPSTPTGLSVSWNGGVCTITWNIADVDYYRLTVDSVTRNIGYTNSYVYTLEQNAIDHGGTPSATLSISLRAVDALNQQSGAATINTTAPLPAQPSGLTTSWASDNGTAEADCVISWTREQGVTYRLTIDSVARNVGQVDRFVYSFAQNQQEHGGNAAATLAISLVAVDPFNRVSSAATTTATNAAPPALTAPSVQGFFSSCRFSWSPSTARDLLRYELDVRVNSTSVGVFSLTDTTYTFETAQSGSIDARVRAVDRFGQVSAWSGYSASVQLTNSAQFVQELRQGVTYRDSVGSSQSVLAALKDSNVTSGGVTYAASTSWQWIEANHNREIRHQTTTLATSTNVSMYLGVSLDGATWTWYYGGSVSAGVWVPSSTTTSETTAQSGAVSVSGIVKIRLSAPVQCRFVRLGMRNTSASYTIREFYPRSLVQSDDIAGETLSAISANLGTITAGSISSVSIDASTITGATITGTTISGGTISGGTITGSTFYTSSSLPRIELDSNGIRYRAADNTPLFHVNVSNNGPYEAGSVYTRKLFVDEIRLAKNVTLRDFFNLVFDAPLYLGNIPISSTQCGLYVDRFGTYIGVVWELENVALQRGDTRVLVESNVVTTSAQTTIINANTTSIRGLTVGYTSLSLTGNGSNPADFVFARASIPGSAGNQRFILRLDTSDNFNIISRNDDGSFRDLALFIHRLNGHLGFGGIPSVSNGDVGSIDVYGDARIRGTLRAKTDWTTIPLENNWQDCGSLTGDPSVAYRIMPDGTVQFRGAIRRTSGTSQRIFTMPTALQGNVVRRVVVSYRSNGSSVFAASQLTYIPSNSHGVFFDGPSITNSSGTTLEGVVMLWMTWNLLG